MAFQNPAFQWPLRFTPLYMERVWGGRRLQDDLGRSLPEHVPIGESWELVDRQEAQSVVDSGELAGTSLHQLWTEFRTEVFGRTVSKSSRFPLLAKILDARETLSVQVHPPEAVALRLSGEPKTEMWYLLEGAQDAALYAGFRHGTTREQFTASLATGDVEAVLHRIPVRAGDAMFIPSGRCHAIGAGCLIVELQQNSDTTYRVFDFNRLGLDGKPRMLHLEESLASMDFQDCEPGLVKSGSELVVACEFFQVERWALTAPRADTGRVGSLFTVISGQVACGGRQFGRGDFFLIPAEMEDRHLVPVGGAACVLRSTLV